MFNLILLLDLPEGRPGMLVPVFSSPNTNMPYVQQLDEFLLVREIIPFLEYENYQVILAEEKNSVAVGDKGIVAFRSFDDEVICGDIEKVLSYIAENRDMIQKNPLLAVQLNRIESAELNPSYEGWRAAASHIFSDEDQIKFWVDSELQLFQKQKKIWADIDPIDPEEPDVAEGGLYGLLTEYGTEYLLRWLNNRTNFSSKHWTKIWHHVHEKIPFDDRLTDVALAWMYSLDADDEDFRQARSVIFALLQGWSLFGKDLPDFGEFLSDRLAADPSLLFVFLRPKNLFDQLFNFLAAKGDLDDVLKLVGFCVTDLPKEPYIVDPLFSTLSTIVSQTKNHEDNWRPSTRNREFEHRHLVIANVTWDRLEEAVNLKSDFQASH